MGKEMTGCSAVLLDLPNNGGSDGDVGCKRCAVKPHGHTQRAGRTNTVQPTRKETRAADGRRSAVST